MTLLRCTLAILIGVALTRASPAPAQPADHWEPQRVERSEAGQGVWAPGFGFPGVGPPEVSTLASDGQHLYVGGSFTVAGDELATRLAAFDLSTQSWSAIGDGINGAVTSLAIAPDGTLYVGGSFTVAGGLEANRVVRYDPSTDVWTPLDGGLDGRVDALALGEDGTLYVAGDFSTAGIVPAGGIAAWDGADWSALGDVDGSVETLLVAGGLLYAGGGFTSIDDTQVSNVAAFDPVTASWQGLGQGVDGSAHALTESGSDIFVGGMFASALADDGTPIPSQSVARWDPMQQTWSAAGLDVFRVTALQTDHDGMLYAGAEGGGQLFRRVDEQWEAIDFGTIPMAELRFPRVIGQVADRLAIGLSGYALPDGNPDPAQFLYAFSPAADQWGVFAEPIGGGVDQTVSVIAGDETGGAYVAGNFSFAGPVAARGVAYRSANGSWSSLGGGVDGYVNVFLPTDDARSFVGGRFGSVTQSSGEELASSGVALWDRAAGAWSPLGGGVASPSGIYSSVSALAAEPDGAVLVGGYFYSVLQPGGEALEARNVARWDPAADLWEALPVGHGLTYVQSLSVDAAGSIYLGGEVVPLAGWRFARLMRLPPGGTEWEILRDWEPTHFTTGVLDLEVWGSPAGAAGGLYALVEGHGIWQWTGGEWQSTDAPNAARTIALNGSPGQGGVLYAGASHDAGPWMWDGQAWATIDGPVASFSDVPHVYALDVVPGQDGTASLWVGGYFGLAGGHPAASMAEWHTTDHGVGIHEGTAGAFALRVAAYPNPFGPVATVEFALPAQTMVRLTVYDVLGRRVATLIDREMSAGTHTVALGGTGLASGPYVVRLSTPSGHRSVLVTRVD